MEQPQRSIVSVIIPCRNEKRHIRDFLDSLLAQERGNWDLEVLVADGMSDDGTREIVEAYSNCAPHVRMIDNPGRIVSTGLNAAILSSRGDIIVRMDAHTVYAPDYIKECVSALRQSGADNAGGPWVARGEGAVGRAVAAASHLPFCSGGGKAHDPDYEGEVDTVYLGCWHRSLFVWTGLFDADLVRNQDDEFNFRLRMLGGRVWQSPKIRSTYTPRSSFRQLFRQYAQYGFWRVAVMRKHRALASWRHLVPGVFAGTVLGLGLASAVLTAAGKWSMAVWAAAALLALFAVHLAAGVLASARLWGKLDIPALLLIPPVVLVHHLAYGAGFLLGCAYFARSERYPKSVRHFFTALTR